MTNGKKILFYSTLIIVATYFLFSGLVKAQALLVPLVTAVILALLMVPLSQKMERGFMNRGSASLLNTLILFLVSVGFMTLFSFQIKNLVDDWDEIKETMKPKVEELKSFVFEHTPLEKEDLDQAGEGDMPMDAGSGSGEKATSFLNAVIAFFADYLLTFIYIFFLLNYRKRFKEFLLRLFPDEKKKNVKKVINNSAKVTQKYLVGKLFLIGLLALLYSIGLGISGVDNFILVSALAALFSLVPYVGNIVGLAMAMAFGYLTSGETMVLVGIIITFSVAQFVESYILEPYVVGDQVDLHPFFVILAVIIGNSVWGIMGMILFIPVLAIINVVFLNIRALHPFGFLLSKKDIPN